MSIDLPTDYENAAQKHARKIQSLFLESDWNTYDLPFIRCAPPQMYERIRDLASQYLGYPIIIDEENVRYVKGPTPSRTSSVST